MKDYDFLSCWSSLPLMLTWDIKGEKKILIDLQYSSQLIYNTIKHKT